MTGTLAANMLKIDTESLAQLEAQYPGIADSIRWCEAEELPPCPRCGSMDTARVHVGLVGRSINMAAATTKFKLVPNGPKSGEFFCNGCREFFHQRHAGGPDQA